MAKPAANRFYSPLVLNIANSEGVSLSELERIPGTGSDGRVSKRDILQYVADKKAGRIPAIQQPLLVVQPTTQATPQPYQQPAPTYTAPVETTPAPMLVAQPTSPPTSQPIVQPTAQTEPVAPVERFAAPTPPQLVVQPTAQQENKPVTEPVYQAAPQPVAQPTAQSAPIAPVQQTIAAPQQPLLVAQPTAQSSPVPPSQDIVYSTAQSSGKFSEPSSVVVSGETEIVEMDRMRKLIAKHMVDSKATSPHVTSFAEADVTNMVMWREKVKKEFEQREGTKLTFTPMFVECLVKAMKRFPLVNCSLNGDQIIIKKDINIGMATALPSGNLIVPVIKGADQLNIVGLSKSVNGLADAARNGKLKPEDTTGGTFTLTNVGTFGSLMGTPIINQPQVAIMAVGAIKKRAVVIESAEGDTIGIRHMMYLSLSYDHRIVDGSIGASFLTAVAKEFEQWDVNKQWFHYL
ncbi:MAG: 2-oxoglutarate dehydrogenase E2 component (dihydrolipoamide succinyltransferase) [Chitinophagaceae bacterium]|nr:MAG: 2-oxoglutarate dehydrogenase E2 component (dihydrolipoamide succinyltransferase) [Chitinophagaceae bacterium]